MPPSRPSARTRPAVRAGRALLIAVLRDAPPARGRPPMRPSHRTPHAVRASLRAGALATLALLAVGCTDDDSVFGPRVTAPAAGALESGMVEVRWDGFDADDVQILVSTDGGSTYPSEVASATQNDGSFALDTTGFADGAAFRVRVTRGGETAESGVFEVDNTAPVLVLGFPEAGDFAGISTTITWTSTEANPGTVAIVASADSGANYDIPVATAAPDSGTFVWSTAGLTEGATYRVRLTPTDAAGNEGAPDESSGDFVLDRTPPSVVLTAPNGGESWTGIESITWTTTEANPSTVTLRASTDSGATFDVLVAEDAPDTGAFMWRTGRIEDTATARVQVVATDLAGNESAADASDADFGAINLRVSTVAHHSDVDGDGAIGAGDTILLRFDKDIVVNAPAASDLALTSPGDSLGAGATVAAGALADELLVTLGAGATFRTRGEFDEDDAGAGRPSGIDVAEGIAADAIEAAGSGIDASPSVAVDLRPRAVDQATLAAAATTARRGALGDLDGDGDLDMVLAITGGAANEVWLNGGDNDWTLQSSFGTGDSRSVALGDVDGDGDLDVLVGNAGANRVWLNDGSAGLTDSGQALALTITQGVALGDLDADGDLDAFFANDSGSDTVWFNDGNGAFANSGQTLGGSNSTAVALGDLDGDGDLDAAVTHFLSGATTVYLNDGSGGFSANPMNSVTQAQDIALGDVDGDGDLDAFIANLGQNRVMLNDGSGGFPGPPQLLDNNDNRGVVLIDLDGDGDLDAVTAKNVDSSKFFINDGSGVFTIDVVDGEPDVAVHVIAGRLDADADPDFVIVNDMGAHRPYRGSAAGGQPDAAYSAADLDVAAARSAAVAVGDLDGDGDADAVVEDLAGPVRVLLGDGAAGFDDDGTFGAAGGRGGDLFDADGDGDLDYLRRVGALGADADELWLGDGAGGFTASGLALGTDAFVVGDVDGDGDADLVAAEAATLDTWDGDGAGGFTASGQSVALANVAYVVAFDYDGDGDLDLAAATDVDVTVLVNDGTGAFTVDTQAAFADVTALAAADLDRDGDVDLVAASSGASTDLSWFRNDGGVLAGPLASSTDETAFTRIALADIDEDGALDLFGAADGTLVILEGDGDGTFSNPTTTAVAALADIALLDADRDGDVDVYEAKGGGATPTATVDALRILD